MKKNVFFRAVSLLIAAVLCMPMIPVLTAHAATPFETRVSQLRQQFPNGKYWNHYVNNSSQLTDNMNKWDHTFADSVTSQPCATHNGNPAVGAGQCDCNCFDGGIQCWGFANRIFFGIFENYASRQSERRDIQNVSVGDWIRCENNNHSAVVLTRNGDYLTIVEGNRDGNCKIVWDRQIHISSINYFKHAPNWEEIVRPHTHSYTTYVRCDDAHPHYKYYKCSCGEVKKTSEVAYTNVTVSGKSATCTESGLTAGTKCSLCGIMTKAQETIPALDHDFQQTGIQSATCTAPASDVFTCSRCGEVKHTYFGGENWSSWSTQEPTGKDAVESKTQYRFSNKETTTSSSSTLEGWTLVGQDYSAWGNWSGWTLGSASSTNTKEVQTGPMYRYGCFRCANCGAQDPYSGACDACGCATMNWDERWSEMSYASSGYAMNGKPYTTRLPGDGRRWYFTMGNLNDTAIGTTDPDSGATVIKAGYRYRTRSIIYNFERWGDFSAWQDAKVTASNVKKVETRTVYRYYIPTATHVDANNDGTCDKCGAAVLKIIKQPANTSVPLGESAKVTVTATGENLKYQWYLKNASASKFSKSSVTNATYSVTMSDSVNGRSLYCVITDTNGNSVQTNTVTLTAAVKITSQPAGVKAAVGATASFTVKATGVGLTYQWQSSGDNGKTWAISGFSTAKSATLNVPVTAARNGFKYRCVVTGSNGKKATSSAATLTVSIPTAVTAQPASAKKAVGDTAVFTVGATGVNLAYQWQSSADNGKTWNDSGFSTAKTATLKVPVTAARNGYKYRCKVTGANGSVTSSAAALTVLTKITAQPASVKKAVGATASFKVEATGVKLTYQWQFSTDGTTWKNSGFSTAKDATLKVPVTAARNGCLYRCVVTGSNGQKATSNAAKLTVS